MVRSTKRRHNWLPCRSGAAPLLVSPARLTQSRIHGCKLHLRPPSRIERLASRGRPYTVELVLSGRAPARKARSDHEPPGVAGRGGQGRQPRDHATLYLTRLHGRADVQNRLIANIGEAFQHVKAAAEQSKDLDRWRCLLRRQSHRARHRTTKAAAARGSGFRVTARSMASRIHWGASWNSYCCT